MVDPLKITVSEPMSIPGKSLIDIVTEAVSEHTPSVTVSVYVVVTCGEATGLAIFGSIFYMDGWMWGQNAHAAPLFFAVTAKLVYDKYNHNKQMGK